MKTHVMEFKNLVPAFFLRVFRYFQKRTSNSTSSKCLLKPYYRRIFTGGKCIFFLANKTQALAEIMNISIWVVGTLNQVCCLNQLSTRGSHAEIKFSKK